MTKAAQERFYQLLGVRIRDARKSAGLKQEALASYLELSRVSIVNIEKGRQHPSVHLLIDLARVLNVEFCSLIPEQPLQDSTVKANWKKIVVKKVKGNKQAGEKLLGFLNELNSSK